jgi:hypothetical protein
MQHLTQVSNSNSPGSKERPARKAEKLTPFTRRLSRRCGILDVSQPHRSPRHVTWLVLIFAFLKIKYAVLHTNEIYVSVTFPPFTFQAQAGISSSVTRNRREMQKIYLWIVSGSFCWHVTFHGDICRGGVHRDIIAGALTRAVSMIQWKSERDRERITPVGTSQIRRNWGHRNTRPHRRSGEVKPLNSI